MKDYYKTILVSAVMGIALSAKAQEVYLQANFDGGIPSDFLLVDWDQNPVSQSYYMNADINGAWVANPIDRGDNQAAFSFSRTMYDFSVDNWMITPQIHIGSEEAYLRWDAKSVHHEFRESYKVLVSTTTNDIGSFQELLSVDEEEYFWKTRVLSLADYVGQDIYLAFECVSRNKFILAIDNLLVGELPDVRIATEDMSRRFVGSDSEMAPVNGVMTNLGQDIEVESIECVTQDGTYSMPVAETWRTGEELEYSFEIPVTLNAVSRYELYAKLAGDDNLMSVYSDSLMCSYYPRLMVAEEGTGSWCNNCPEGTLAAQEIAHRLKDDVAVIAVHMQDELTCSGYSSGLMRWVSNIPGFIFNRVSATHTSPSEHMEGFDKAMLTETTAYVEMEAVRTEDEPSKVNLSTRTSFAVPYDNVNGYYGIGFALIEDTVPSPEGMVQANSSTLLSSDEYYYLPVYIQPEEMIYRHVVRASYEAFDGVEGSLPEAIEAGETYDFDYEIEIPEELLWQNDLSLVAYVLNSRTGVILNAARVELPAFSDPTGIGSAKVEEMDSNIEARLQDGTFEITFPCSYEPYSVSVYSVNGMLLKTVQGNGGKGLVSVDCPAERGWYILRAIQGDDIYIQKFYY